MINIITATIKIVPAAFINALCFNY